MERTVTYRLVVWFGSFYDDDSRIWGLNPENMSQVYDLGDGQVWKFD